MRRILALVMLAGLAAVPGCHKQPEGVVKVIVIGNGPKLRDPIDGPIAEPDQVMLANVAQGLVRFDPSGNVVSGLAERWTVTDDGLDYIFRLAATNWPDGTKLTAQQVARILKREIGSRSRNPLKDQLGAVDDVVAMTDRVIEINLIAPRPDFLSLLAQPEMAIMRNGQGTGPFKSSVAQGEQIKLTRAIVSAEDETARPQQVLLQGAQAGAAIASFESASADLVIGGTFADLPQAQHAQLEGGALEFDPASGLFGLVPARSGGPLDKPEIRQLLGEALDRQRFIAALGVPGLAPRETLLEPGLDGIAAPAAPAWAATSYGGRLPGLQAQANRLFPNGNKPSISVALPDGPGANLLLALLQQDWGALGLTVARAKKGFQPDFLLIDMVAPSSSAAWFVRQFRCGRVPVCDPQADQLMDGARQTPVLAQRYALLQQAAARIDDDQLFLPLAAPVRWSLVSTRVQNFAGNRYALHTLTDLEAKPSSGE